MFPTGYVFWPSRPHHTISNRQLLYENRRKMRKRLPQRFVSEYLFNLLKFLIHILVFFVIHVVTLVQVWCSVRMRLLCVEIVP